MLYNVQYLDKTGAGVVFNEDIELEQDHSDDKDLLKQAFKQEIVKKLKNIPQESDITINDWQKKE